MNSLQDPYVLKASPGIDINATGALNEFALLRRKDGKDGGDRFSIDFKSFEIFETDTMRWSAFTKETCTMLYEYVAQVKNGVPPSKVDEAIRPYILNALNYQMARDHVKQASKIERDHIFLLSLVIGEHNIESVISTASDDKKMARVVKLMKKTIEVSDCRLTTYIRLSAQKKWNNSNKIDAQPIMFQLECMDNGDFLTATRSHVIIRKEGYSNGTQKIHNNFAHNLHAIERVLDDSNVLESVAGILEVKLPASNDKWIGDDLETPVCILQVNNSPLELLSHLNDTTCENIAESKDEAPTFLHDSARLTDEDGSAFKYCEDVSLAIFEQQSRLPFSGFSLKTVPLERSMA